MPLRIDPKRETFFATKYVVERFMGAVLLALFSPLIVLLWLAVRLTSKGPGFYRQTRVGLDGKNFRIFKLRSMCVDAEKDGMKWATANDCRKTWLGNILRKLHLDELPQLINVVRGEMVLIGPRPERPEICNELELHVAGYRDRNRVKPGITGLSQVNLPPDETLEDVFKKQILDIQYINETNFWLEVRILAGTFLRMVGIKGETTMRWMRLCRLSVLDEMQIQAPEGSTETPVVDASHVPESKLAGKWITQPSREIEPVYVMATGDVDLHDSVVRNSSTPKPR